MDLAVNPPADHRPDIATVPSALDGAASASWRHLHVKLRLFGDTNLRRGC